MLHKLSQKITDHYVKKNKIDDSERDVYEYCFEVLLSTFLNLLAIIILAVATGLYLETLCFTISFMTLRGTAGGYHAKTHWGCFLILMLVYAIFAITLFFIPKDILRFLSIGFATVGGIAILILSPVDNVNNQFTIEQTKKYKRKTIVFMAVFLVAYVIMIFLFSHDAKLCLPGHIALWQDITHGKLEGKSSPVINEVFSRVSGGI